MVECKVAKNASLNLDLLCVSFPLNLVACLKFLLVHNANRLKHLHALCLKVVVEDERAAGFAVKTALSSFFLPFIAIAVAIESNWLALLNILAYNANDCLLFLYTRSDECIYF